MTESEIPSDPFNDGFLAHYIEITYVNNARVLSGPFLTRNAANRAMIRMIRQSRTLDVNTDSEITNAKLIER